MNSTKSLTSSHLQQVAPAKVYSQIKYLIKEHTYKQVTLIFRMSLFHVCDEFLGPFTKVTSPKTGIYETTIGGVVLQVLSGDITKETTDIIVNSTNENFTLKAGTSG